MTQPTDSTEKRILILDAHGSHITTEFMWEYYQNNILLLYLTPDTSHVLQLLDLGFFRHSNSPTERDSINYTDGKNQQLLDSGISSKTIAFLG